MPAPYATWFCPAWFLMVKLKLIIWRKNVTGTLNTHA
jgi:hypothetical protein